MAAYGPSVAGINPAKTQANHIYNENMTPGDIFCTIHIF